MYVPLYVSSVLLVLVLCFIGQASGMAVSYLPTAETDVGKKLPLTGLEDPPPLITDRIYTPEVFKLVFWFGEDK